MSLKQGVSLVGILLFCFLIAFVSGSLFFGIGDSSAESKTVDIKARVNDVIGITTITTDAVNGELVLDIMPTPSGTLAKNQLTVTVSTNNFNGYTLSMNSLTNNTSMVHEAATGSPPAPNIPSTTHDYNAPAALGTDTWGWNLGTATATNTFMKIPPSNDSQTLKVTAEPNESSDNTIVTFGANVTSTMPAGNYINTIVFTATSNYTPPPEGNFTANDEAAKITTFDEHGVLTSTMVGLIPIDYTNSTTYTNTTTTSVGNNNYNIIKGYLEAEQQIDVDDDYLIQTTNIWDYQILDLYEGDSVRIRGVGDKHKFIVNARAPGATYAVFEFKEGVNLYVQNVDFELLETRAAPKTAALFKYNVNENYATTTFLIDEIIIRDCSFTGAMRMLNINATPPASHIAEREDPSKHVIDRLVVHNNKYTDVYAVVVILLSDPYVKEFRFTNNDIKNSGWMFIDLMNDNTSNASIGGSTAHNNPSRPSTLYVDYNTFVNDDDFDIHLAWKDTVETTAAPWGNDRTTWTGSSQIQRYLSLIIEKGTQDIIFSNNLVEGLSSWGVNHPDSYPIIYGAYLSGQDVLYENNTFKNLVNFHATKPLAATTMFKAKNSMVFEGSNRITRNNKYIVEENFPSRVIPPATLAGISKDTLLDMMRVQLIEEESTQETVVFENNYIDVYNLVPYINASCFVKDMRFDNNIINAQYLRSSGTTALSAFVCIAPSRGQTNDFPPSVQKLTRTMNGNTVNVAHPDDTGSGKTNIALIINTSSLLSEITVENNTFNMADFLYIYSAANGVGVWHQPSDIVNMTLNFNNNIVTSKPAGNIVKKDPRLSLYPVFNQFNGNTTSPGFNFTGE